MTDNGQRSGTSTDTGVPAGNPLPARACLGGHGLLSIIMPVYNLERLISDNISRVDALFRNVIPYEIVPVDDGSVDGTADAIRRAAAAHPDIVKPVFLTGNRGKGAALSQGFAATTGSHILLLDADLDLNPELIWTFFAIMRRDRADIVIGSKMHPDSKIDYPWRRRLASRVYYGIVKMLMGLPVQDTQTGMKLFRRPALEYALSRMLAKRFAFDLEVLSIANEKGFVTSEAPVELDFHDKAGCLSVQTIREVMVDTLAIFYRLRILGYYRALEPRPMPAVLPRVTAIIACPGASVYLEQCLAGLERQAWPDLEVLILPDAPTGRCWPPHVREVPTGRVRPAEKRNRGIAEATGELTAFIDDDACPLDGWLAHAIPYFGDPAIAAVGGPAVTPPGEPWLARAGARVYENGLVSGAYRRRYKPTRVCDEEDLPSCNLIVRTDVLRELGGFDVRYWPGEDTLLCLGIVHHLRRRIVYDPRVGVSHHRRPLWGPHLRQVARYACHRGHFVRRFPQTSLRFAYFVPTLFVAGVTAGLPLAFLHPFLRLVYCGAIVFYALATGLSCLSLRRPLLGLATWTGVVATHVTYGVCFLRGLCSRKMRHEVRPFDHLGGEAGHA